VSAFSVRIERVTSSPNSFAPLLREFEVLPEEQAEPS
jgi:hypothetical protein